MLTQEYLKECLSYDPESGIFVYKNKTHNRVKPGSIAGSKHIAGYLTIRINRKAYLCHRLAWLYVYGNFPD